MQNFNTAILCLFSIFAFSPLAKGPLTSIDIAASVFNPNSFSEVAPSAAFKRFS